MIISALSFVYFSIWDLSRTDQVIAIKILFVFIHSKY
jgi:hypothetical protein